MKLTVDLNLTIEQYSQGLTEALAAQLCSSIHFRLSLAASQDPHMRQYTRKTGVYLLYYEGRCFYIGKSTKKLATRLKKHWDKLKALPFVNSWGFTCQLILISCPSSTLAAEDILIRINKLALNKTDFGNNSDPARDAIAYRPNRRHWQPIFEDFVGVGCIVPYPPNSE